MFKRLRKNMQFNNFDRLPASLNWQIVLLFAFAVLRLIFS